MFIAVSITLLFTGRLYSDPALKKTLRLPIGTKDDTYDRISETVEFYDRHAEEYAEIWAQDDPNMPPFYERFPNLVPKGSVVLDSGCGPGRDLLWFLDNGYSATGIDLSEATVRLANERERLKGKVSVMDIRDLSFPDGHFGAVWDNATFLHIPEKEADKVIKGYWRILKEEGILFIRVKEGEGEDYVEEKVLKGGAYGGEKRFYKFYQQDELRSLLERNGFEIVEIGVRPALERPISWVYAYGKKIAPLQSSPNMKESIQVQQLDNEYWRFRGIISKTRDGKSDLGTFSIQLALEILGDIDKKKLWSHALTSLFFQIRTLGFREAEPPFWFRQPIINEWDFVWRKKIDSISKKDPDLREVQALIKEMKDTNVISLGSIPKEVIKDRTFVVRVDFNDIHFDEKEEGIDDIRLNVARETLNYILSNGGKVVLLTHSGRPSGKGAEEDFNLGHVKKAVEKLLGITNVKLLQGKEFKEGQYALVTEEVISQVRDMKSGEVSLLDNTRFDWREKSRDPAERQGLAYDLSQLGDMYVLDGFPISHRPDSSVNEMCKTTMPSLMGFWMEREIDMHQRLLNYIKNPNRGSMAAIFGGIKKDKIGPIKEFSGKLKKGDKILIGGLLADIIRRDNMSWVEGLRDIGIEVVLSLDNVDGKDIGPETIKKFKEVLSKVEFVYWNSPQGQFEVEPYHKGSYEIAGYIKERIDGGYMSAFVSGGETAPLVKAALGLDETKRLELQRIERNIGKTQISMPVLTISTGGGTTTDFVVNDGNNIGQQSLWGISPLYLMYASEIDFLNITKQSQDAIETGL